MAYDESKLSTLGQLKKLAQKIKDVLNIANSESTVSVQQVQSTGTKIATLTIDSNPTDIYDPSKTANESQVFASCIRIYSSTNQASAVKSFIASCESF